MRLPATLGGPRRAIRHLTCALAVAVAPGCITYSTATNTATYRDLGIAAALATVEIGGGLLGGYLVSREDGANEEERTFHPMLSVTGGILLVDAIFALGLYLSDD